MWRLKATGWTLSKKFFQRLGAFGLVVTALAGLPGCGDLSGLLGGDTTFAAADLVGTWTGSLTKDNQTQIYLFTVDSSGGFISGDGTTGTAAISSAGKVTFDYTANGYAITLTGTMNSAKTKITMTTSSWTGADTGSSAFTGTLTNTTAGNFTAADLVGTWAGSLTENGVAQNYSFTVDGNGGYTSATGTSGTVTISSSGNVVFTYSSGGYTGTFQGTMNSAKTQIIMSTHTWAGTSTGSAAFTGTLSKSATGNFTAADLVGIWTGSLTANGQAQNYEFTVDASGNFVAGDNTTTGTATISAAGAVAFTYTSNGYTVSLKGTMNSAKTKIVMSTSSWTGSDSGSSAFTGTLTKS